MAMEKSISMSSWSKAQRATFSRGCSIASIEYALVLTPSAFGALSATSGASTVTFVLRGRMHLA